MFQLRLRVPRLSPFLSLLALAAVCNAAATSPSIVSQAPCNGQTYTYQGLAGYGFVPSNFVDKFGDTISLGSSIAMEEDSWKKKDRKRSHGQETYYAGILWMLPDRGWLVSPPVPISVQVRSNCLLMAPLLRTGIPMAPQTGNPEYTNLLLNTPHWQPVPSHHPHLTSSSPTLTLFSLKTPRGSQCQVLIPQLY